MITIKRLKELIKDLPDNARCFAYEGESTGINIYDGNNLLTSKKVWWIDAKDNNKEDTYTEGFKEQKE